jgi:hypothetical protein
MGWEWSQRSSSGLTRPKARHSQISPSSGGFIILLTWLKSIRASGKRGFRTFKLGLLLTGGKQPLFQES